MSISLRSAHITADLGLRQTFCSGYCRNVRDITIEGASSRMAAAEGRRTAIPPGSRDAARARARARRGRPRLGQSRRAPLYQRRHHL